MTFDALEQDHDETNNERAIEVPGLWLSTTEGHVAASSRRGFLGRSMAAVTAGMAVMAPSIVHAKKHRKKSVGGGGGGLGSGGGSGSGDGTGTTVGGGGSGGVNGGGGSGSGGDTISAERVGKKKGGGNGGNLTGGNTNSNLFPELYPGQNAANFSEIRADENAHVQTIIQLIQSLGGTPRPEPTFQKLAAASMHDFIGYSNIFENTGVKAYQGAAPVISSPAVLAAAASIALVEGLHSGYLNALTNNPLVPGSLPFSYPYTVSDVVTGVTPFIASLNGGPAPTFSTTPSAANDIAILNFALLLEYLERDFYNLNVKNFFGV